MWVISIEQEGKHSKTERDKAAKYQNSGRVQDESGRQGANGLVVQIG